MELTVEQAVGAPLCALSILSGNFPYSYRVIVMGRNRRVRTHGAD